MADQTVEGVDPQRLQRNPENPRLIFREDELAALQESIRNQGILVPLTVYADGRRLVLLDGERRWRCAVKLGLHRVPGHYPAEARSLAQHHDDVRDTQCEKGLGSTADCL